MAAKTTRDPSFASPDSPAVSMHGARGESGPGDAVPAENPDDRGSTADLVHEKSPEVVLNKRQKFKRHCGRFKWWYLLGLVIFLAIILPILFEVIIPALVQNIVNDQTLPIHSGIIRALSPTQLSISLNTSLNTPLPARIEPMDMYLYNENTTDYSPFVKLSLPEQHVHHRTYIVVTNQTVTVDNEDELVAWFNDIFDLPLAGLSVRASPRIHLGALSYDPSLDITVEVPALNALNGFDIQSMEFLMEPNENGRNLRGYLNLPNAGVLTLGLGNVTFNMMSGDTQLGIITLYNAELPPGNNTREFDGNIYFDQLIPNLSAILDSQQNALSQGFIEINATGNATVVNGEHIAFVERVFRTKSLLVQIPIVRLLGDVINSVLDGGQESLVDAFGDVFGNATLFDHIMDHWDEYDGPTNITDVFSRKQKRAAPSLSLMMNMLRLGMRLKK
ncbi:hypothetical protein S7711_04735 [Stachybotrys chartarum IBT 7711]|uniref:Uncharacterized protein n=1 Tax=Stachybotrys chartarum (strain CBS 109288 / IBT 7711) TaxID=1280523 RepID=A0A084AP32_STACB|nr:hypothetical protein S7711_04735 [Stachybotrys chartarum IBT 7711]